MGTGVLDKRIEAAKRPGKWGAIQALMDKANDVELFILAATQTTNIDATDDILFATETINTVSGEERFTIAAGVVTLPVGGVYELEAVLACDGTTVDAQVSFHNGTAPIGVQAEYRGVDQTDTQASQPVMKAVVNTVSAAVSVSVQIVAETGLAGVLASASYLLVKRLA